MTERRIVHSEQGCPACGCPDAIVRVRGNAFAATCLQCRATFITPMLGARELADCFAEHEPVQPVSIMRAPSVLPERELLLPVSRALIDDAAFIGGEIDRRMSIELRTRL